MARKYRYIMIQISPSGLFLPLHYLSIDDKTRASILYEILRYMNSCTLTICNHKGKISNKECYFSTLNHLINDTKSQFFHAFKRETTAKKNNKYK